MSFKLNQKVRVIDGEHNYTGKIEKILKWENPFSVLHKKGTDYHVRADDNNELYKATESMLSKI